MPKQNKGFMSSKIAETWKPQKKINKPREEQKKQPGYFNIKEATKELAKFNASFLTGSDKRDWKRERLIELGAKVKKESPHKSVKTYNMQKALKEKKKKAEFEKLKERFGDECAKRMIESNTKNDVNYARKYVNQLRGNHRGDKGTVGDGSVGFTLPFGKIRDGNTLVLSSRDVKENILNNRDNEGGGREKKKNNKQIKKTKGGKKKKKHNRKFK